MQKECPNPTCKAHIEQWEFYENEDFCSVCGERLRPSGSPSLVAQPSNTAGLNAAARNEPYIDTYMQVRNSNNSWLYVIGFLLLIGILSLVIYVLLNSALFKPTNLVAGTPATITSADATATADAVSAKATALAIARLTPLPVGNRTPEAGMPQPVSTFPAGSFPTATPLPSAINAAEAPPPVVDANSRAMVQNVGMVASCDNSAPRQTYRSDESFYLMVQANYNHTQVREVHTVWYGPPGFNTVFNAQQGALSIDNPDASKRLRDGGSYYVCFQASPQPAGTRWQSGNYRVVVYINDNIPVDYRQFYVTP